MRKSGAHVRGENRAFSVSHSGSEPPSIHILILVTSAAASFLLISGSFNFHQYSLSNFVSWGSKESKIRVGDFPWSFKWSNGLILGQHCARLGKLSEDPVQYWY